jgi:multicomponent Na+:H+ antiporter subunit A
MLYAVLSGFVLAALTPLLYRAHQLLRQHIGWLLALLPLALACYFASFIAAVSGGEVIVQQWQWLPGLGINLGFMLDGLSLLFALLISVIGAVILVYAGGYLHNHAYLVRFFVILLCFMAAMLGLVLSDNLITLFVFWELTSITSYLLIGFNHQDESARKAALQGLLVTVGGGLALMAGLIMLAGAADSYQLSQILSDPQPVRESPLLTAIMLCILAGCFTKSAQFPFHFWLPNAMAAPTPVSAYLHSATMVKAGIYLMARLNPVFSSEELWSTLLLLAGGATLFTGAWLAYSATDIKKVLAYSTVMALGVLTLLIGIGTPVAMLAFVCFLLAHSLYKGALFMLAGVIDHSTGSKDLQALGGLRKSMPITAACALLVCLSLAGLPPLFGFIAKELLFEAVLSARWLGDLLLVVVLMAAMLTLAVAAVIAIKPFFGPLSATPQTPHEGSPSLLLGPVLLAGLSLLFGLLPILPETWLVRPAVNAVIGVAGLTTNNSPPDFYLSLWHGFNLPLLLSVISLMGGLILFLLWPANREGLAAINRRLAAIGPEAGYFRLLDATVAFSGWQTRVLQNGKTGNYMIVLIMTTVLLSGYTLLSQYGFNATIRFDDVSFYELAVMLLILLTVMYVISTRSRLGAVATLGVLGFSVALVFILFSAPDLGITQVLVETLTVILLVLVLFRLPGFAHYSTPFERIRDALVAIAFGCLMTLLTLAAIDVHYFDSIAGFFVENSYSAAHGRNIVNVILVDFRALDTLGEIFVLGIAALGVFSMIKLRAEVADDEKS